MNFDNLEGLAQALFEESGDALFLLDPETEQLLDANATAQRLTGFCLRDLLRMPMAQLIRFGGQGGLRRLRESTSRTSAFHSQEGYFLCTMQPELWIPINLTVSRLHVKPRTLALLTARDLRELRRTHVRLREVEEEFRRLVAAVPDCLWSGDLGAAGHIVYRSVSPAVAGITGRPPDFFLGGAGRWRDLVHPEDRPRWAEIIVRLRSAGLAREEYRVVRPDGAVRWVREHVRAGPGAGGGPVRLDGVICDITESKMAEEGLRRAHERCRAFLDGGAAAFLKDREGRLVYCNAPFARLLRTTPAALLGKTEADLWPADLAARLCATDAAALAAPQPPEVVDGVPSADGAALCWLVFKFPVEDAGGRLVGTLAFEYPGRKQPEGLLPEADLLPHA